MNTLHLALHAIKERCGRQQRRLDELEVERSSLLANRSHLTSTIQRLDEDNLRLRQKNLELNHELHRNSWQTLELKDQLDQALQDLHQEKQHEEPMSIMEPEPPAAAAEDDLDDLTFQLIKANDRMCELKDILLGQQDTVKQLIVGIATNNSCISSSSSSSSVVEQQNIVREETQVSLVATAEKSPMKPENKDKRLCPMCEADYPPAIVTQDEFETHVLGHFSVEEESETLKYFDLVPDAHQVLSDF